MSDEKVRVDKWLWAARFYKTRTAATEAVHGGKIEVNGEAAKPARLVAPGDTIAIRIAPYQHVVILKGVAERRGSAAIAGALYEETEASRSARERQRELLRLAPTFEFTQGKPSKKERRAFEKVRGRK